MKEEKYCLSLCKNKDKWDSFIDSSPQGNIFSKTSFLEALPVKSDCWLVESESQILIGAIILKDNNEPLPQQYMFSLYQGLFLSDLEAKMPIHSKSVWLAKVVPFLLDNLTQKYNLISFCLHPSVNDLREIQWYNFHRPEKGKFDLTLRYTGIIELKKYDFINYLSLIRKTRRNEYNQASKHLIVKESNDINILDKLHNATFERQGIKRKPEESALLKSITKASLANKFGKLLVCYNLQNRPLSASLFLYDKRCGYYLFGANDPDYRKTNSGTFLFLENVKKAIVRNIQYIDVCGINSPNRGDFKTSLNAKPTPYYIATWKNPKYKI